MTTQFDGSFRDFLAADPGARFTDWLAARAEPYWSDAANHVFTQAIGDGSVPEEAYARYLIEDYTFITDLASTIGFLVAKAPAMRSKSRLSGFLALLTSEENDYFLRSFKALGVDPEVYEAAAQGPVTRAFAELLLTASGKGRYTEGLACLLCAEWCYLTWGLREAQNRARMPFISPNGSTCTPLPVSRSLSAGCARKWTVWARRFRPRNRKRPLSASAR